MEKEKSKIVADNKSNINNNINDNSESLLQLKSILKTEDIDSVLNDDVEYEKIKQKLKNYKETQQKEIESLEEELIRLKNENEYINNNDEKNNNIFIDENIIEKLKENIIKEIEPKIYEEIKKNSPNLNNIKKLIEEDNEKNINNKFTRIITDVEIFKKGLMKKYQNSINPNMNKNPNNNKKKEKGDGKVGIKMNDGSIKIIKLENKQVSGNSNANINVIRDEDNNKNKNLMQSYSNYNNYEQKNKDNNNLNVKIKKDNPVVINPNYIQLEEKKEVIQRKNSNNNLFSLFNKIFFKNEEQTSIKSEKISENRLEYLTQKYFKYKKEKREMELIKYFDNFLKTNVFKYFTKKNIEPRALDNLKYNIEMISEHFEIGKNIYDNYFYPELDKNTEIRDRKKSVEAAIKFRKTFNVDESIIKEEELYKKLELNKYDINDVFQQIFG